MTRRVLLGAFNGRQVLRISMPGYDVTSNLAPEFLSFDSESEQVGTVRWAGDGVTGSANSAGISQATITFPTPFSSGVIPIVYVFSRRGTSITDSLPCIWDVLRTDEIKNLSVTNANFNVALNGGNRPFTYYVLHNKV